MKPHRSITEVNNFNLFMSDIDLILVITNEEIVNKSLRSFSIIKFFIINLGEVEIYTKEEWDQIRTFESRDINNIWRKIFQIRKINWQKSRIEVSKNQYEIVKAQRSIEKSKKFLLFNGSLNVFLGEMTFANLKEMKANPLSIRQIYSKYLESYISCELVGKEEIYFENFEKFNYFIQIIPGLESSEVLKDDLVRVDLLQREIISARNSYRLNRFKNNTNKEIEMLNWIRKLEETC